ncbi:helix-turn-helix domain-containing protein [Cryptosporangium minutisporangium]|uniref:AraC family transcriptional regulator n=1 Tax=Cryptosporangium minutisporangium TaxID=113569 RepID=A0ABP6T5B8_9ACTN
MLHAPSTATELVLSVCSPGEPELVALGPRTRALYYRPNAEPLAPRFRLTAGQARAVVGVPLTELADRVVPLSELPAIDAGQLVIRWFDVPGEPGTALGPYLAATAPDAERETRWVRAAADRLVGTAGRPPAGVAAVADDLGVSERHLRNRFAAAVGVSPKHYARIERVRRLLGRIGSAPWARLATEAGFYDQSHLGREFRQLMGVPPGAFAAGHTPPPKGCSTATSD